jgi:type II secretory pathway pseudopilin PulG
MNSFPLRRRGLAAAFTTIELVVAIVLFSAATSGILYLSKSMRDHRTAASASSQQNAYATFQSSVALQGINPAMVGNPLTTMINQSGTTGTAVALGTNTSQRAVRDRLAAFELRAVTQPTGAQRNLVGSARVDAVNYAVASAGRQSTRGAGVGFGIEISGTAPIALVSPTFNIQGDLTAATFPLNNIATLPATNPPGTSYRYTTDGTMPTAASPLWDNNPAWTTATFPAQVTLAAFNPNPAYEGSVPVTVTYSMNLIVTYSRADGRSINLFGFTLGDVGSPDTAGVMLTANAPGFTISYTLDGSDPSISGTAYTTPFAPAQGQFSPNVTLKYAAYSTDPRITSSNLLSSTLSSIAVPLGAPSFVTSNAVPLSPGTDVVISVSGTSASPRTEVNNGIPSPTSSSATSFPLN